MHNTRRNQQGIAHLGLVLAAVIVVAVIGFAGWKVIGGKKSSSAGDVAATVADKASQAAANAECQKENDKDLCKFMTSWKLSTKYRMTSTDPDGSKSIFELDGTKSHIAVTGETSYELITIGKTTYTKSGDVWYKQTVKDSKQDATSDYKLDLKDPEDETNTPEQDKTTYKALGKEACDKLTCFKYQVVDPSSPNDKQYIWFDDQDYQLRRSRTENADGVSEQTYAYANVKISEPSPVKELGPDQYIVPGSSEPMTVPSGASADYSQYQ